MVFILFQSQIHLLKKERQYSFSGEGKGLSCSLNSPPSLLASNMLIVPSSPYAPGPLPPHSPMHTASAMGTTWARVTHLTGKSMLNRKEIDISLITASFTLLHSGPKARAQ